MDDSEISILDSIQFFLKSWFRITSDFYLLIVDYCISLNQLPPPP